jgi:hypothetical protein
MRETKQLHAASEKQPLPRRAVLLIQETNLPHQIFSGNVTFIEVTYPTVWQTPRRLPSLAPLKSSAQVSAEVCSLALGSQIFMAVLLPEGSS